MRAWSAAAGTPWRRLAIVAANPRGAIYGTIVATAVIAAYAAGGKSPDVILAATVATLLVFWLAHVYAHFLDHRQSSSGAGRPRSAAMRTPRSRATQLINRP